MDSSSRSASQGQAQQSQQQPSQQQEARRSSTASTTTTTVDQASAAAASLQLLLREDPLLESLTQTGAGTDQVAFPYAAALLKDDNHNNNNSTSTSASAAVAQQRADLALQDVERKLALVESLAVKLSRTSPEAVAGHLLRLHGHHDTAMTTKTTTAAKSEDAGAAANTTTSSTAAVSSSLQAIRDRADRLERQSESLHAVARRVETSLTRGLDRMDAACVRLERVLQLSSTLKKMMRWQFEQTKLQTYDLDDVRDLTRAAASVAVLQDHGSHGHAAQGVDDDDDETAGIHVLDELRPQAAATARAVRQAAAALLQTATPGNNLSQLGSTLQVYYHLGELPDAVWKAVQDAHKDAKHMCRQLWNPVTLANVMEQAKKNAKDSRSLHKHLRQVRAEAAQEWAAGLEQICTTVRNLERVLWRKTDPVQRVVYMQVVAASPIPPEYHQTTSNASTTQKDFSLFSLFWGRLCVSLAETVESVLNYENGKLIPEVAGLYPAVRSSSLELVGRLQESSSSLSHDTAGLDETTMGMTTGILGGSAALEDAFLEWTTGEQKRLLQDNPQAAAASQASQSSSADSWTLPKGAQKTAASAKQRHHALVATSWAAVIASAEWKELTGTRHNESGLYPLEQAFLTSCRERLHSPLQYMFPAADHHHHLTLDHDDAAVAAAATVQPSSTMLPSKYDLQRFDETIRQELSLADPREGGGDLSAVPMICDCVVTMISDFCLRAKNALLSGSGSSTAAGGGSYVTGADNNWTMTESLQHDRKVVAIMYTLANYLRQAAEKTFVAPYRPATLPLHQEAADLCQAALAPAIATIDATVQSCVLGPVCRALNSKIATTVLAKMHLGVYLEGAAAAGGAGAGEEDFPAFCQKHMAPVFDAISKNFLARFPPPYAARVASTVATYSLYSFVSNASLVRPLGETARLHITQDLADLELTLDQFVGGSLSQLQGGRPYAELRAVRQMIFWSGLEIASRSAADLAKALLREPWIKDVRPSTVFQYLFSYAPSLLSSPHHAKRLKADEYVTSQLVQLDGSVEYGEEDSWMTTMACCDAYQQRKSASSDENSDDGDARVAEILMALGPELLRRRRR